MSDDTGRVNRIAELAVDRDLTVATSESLTSGTIAKMLGAGPDAADWFRGGIVAYQEAVKFDVLGVAEGPVVTAECAEQMARGARELLGADVVVSATGVGGPEPSEGKPAGTVFVGVATSEAVTVRELSLDGGPDDVLDQTASTCLALLEETLRRA
jgi:nicotinamide-nucleotide amidase